MSANEFNSMQISRLLPVWLGAAATGRRLDPMLVKYGMPWRGLGAATVSDAMSFQAQCIHLTRFARMAVPEDALLGEIMGSQFTLRHEDAVADWLDVQFLRLADDVYRNGLDLQLAEVDLYRENPAVFGWWCYSSMVLGCTVTKIETSMSDPCWRGSEGLLREVRLNSVMVLRSRCRMLKRRINEGPRTWFFEPPKRFDRLLFAAS